jgi:hypothetical protein
MQSNPKAGKYNKQVFNVTQKYNTNQKYLQTEAEETVPEHQLGFCQILAGIYETHTHNCTPCWSPSHK